MILPQVCHECEYDWTLKPDYCKECELIKTPICPSCKKKMENAIDSKTKKLSPYLWKCDCKAMENMRLSVG